MSGFRTTSPSTACGIARIHLTDQPTTLVALVRSAFGIGLINTLALTTTSTDGLVTRPIESQTAYRHVALFWHQRRSRDQAVHAFLRAIDEAELPDGVVALQPTAGR
jgi:LysR family carnitine catabolism transcriptional activator